MTKELSSPPKRLFVTYA